MGAVKWNWAVGVTTAPRKIPTVNQCLKSMSQAGWKSPRLFIEPDAPSASLPSDFATTRRTNTMGAFPNWYLGLSELFLREPHADAYLISQDDGFFAKGVKEYLESTLWPSANIGVISLYCPSHEHVEGVIGYREIDRGWGAWGAVTYVFSNPGIRSLLSDSVVLNHRHHGPAAGMRNIDAVVGSWCQRCQLPYFVHIPTLVQHIGRTSTVKEQGRLKGSRIAVNFDPEFPSKQSPPLAAPG